jgi:hypothetical protein
MKTAVKFGILILSIFSFVPGKILCQDTLKKDSVKIAKPAEDCADPKISIAGKTSGNILSGEILTAKEVLCSCPDVKVSSFQVSFVAGGITKTFTSSGPAFTPQMTNFIAKAGKGTKMYLEKVMGKNPEGLIKKLPGATFTIK